MPKTCQAVILVGGLGTRLGLLTANTPKPLLDVDGKPFLSYLIDALARQGFNDILLLAGYNSNVILEFVSQNKWLNINIRCIVESEPLGTGGALRNAYELLAETFLLLNGDTIFDINLNDLTSPFLGSSIIRLALLSVPETARYGRVVLVDGKVIALEEKGAGGAGLINGGIYFISKAAIDLLPLGSSSLEKDLLPCLIADGRVEGREYKGFFLDIGIPADYEKAQRAVPRSLLRPAAFLDRNGVLNVDMNYASRPVEFRWADGAKAAVKLLNDANFYVFVVTNQAGIEREYFDQSCTLELYNWMQQELREVGANIDAFYFCPHRPDFADLISYRKPKPEILMQAFNEWSIDVNKSFLISDKDWGINDTEHAGIKGYLFNNSNLLEFVVKILNN
jgi:D,D-heptose 1,7-bisphosphate phosphatase